MSRPKSSVEIREDKWSFSAHGGQIFASTRSIELCQEIGRFVFRGRRRLLPGKAQEPHHQPIAKDVSHHSVMLVGTIGTIHGQRKERHRLGPSPSGGNVMLHSENHFRKQIVVPLLAIQRLSGARIQPTCLAADPRGRLCEGAPPLPFRKIRKSEQRKMARTKWTSIKTKVDATLISPLKNPTKMYEAYKLFKSHHDEIYVVDIKFHQTLNG